MSGPASGPEPRSPAVSAALLESRLPALLSLWRRRLGPGSRGGAPGSASRGEIEAVGAALLRLQRGLTGGRSLVGAPYMEDEALLGAYLLYYWPVSYLQTAFALATLGRGARRVLDLGAGPGPGAAALLDAGAKELCLVDGSERALALASALLGPEAAGGLATRRLDLEAGPELPEGPFDAILLCHSLNELWKGEADRLERRLALLEAAGKRLSAEGFLLVIEPALLGTSREALALRDGLAARAWSIAGPCVRQGPCPALAAGPGRTCHGETAWAPPPLVAALAARAGLERSSVKATWFAALPPGRDYLPPRAEAGKGSILGPARVVSEGLLNKAGRLRYLLCGEEGYATLSARADAREAWSPAFSSLKRYDLVLVRGPEPREGGGFGLGPGSQLELLS